MASWTLKLSTCHTGDRRGEDIGLRRSYRSFTAEKFSRGAMWQMFLLSDNLIINLSLQLNVLHLKYYRFYTCGCLLVILEAKVVHPKQHQTIRNKGLMLAERITEEDTTSVVHCLLLSSAIKFHYFFVIVGYLVGVHFYSFHD